MSKKDYEKHERSRRDVTEETPELCSIFKGEVASIQAYGAFIKIPGYRKNGLVHKSQISSTRVEDVEEVLAVGDKVFCKVISLGEEGNGKISLSMKVVNQGDGHDLDPNLVVTSQEEMRKKKGGSYVTPKIELGAVLNTVCRQCGTKGHLSQNCFQAPGSKSYELLPELDLSAPPAEHGELKNEGHRKKKAKKEKKKHKKKSKKKKKHKHSSSDSDSDSPDSERDSSKRHSKKHKRKRKQSSSDSDSSSSDSDSDSPKRHSKKKRKHRRSRSNSVSDPSEDDRKKKEKRHREDGHRRQDRADRYRTDRDSHRRQDRIDRDRDNKNERDHRHSDAKHRRKDREDGDYRTDRHDRDDDRGHERDYGKRDMDGERGHERHKGHGRRDREDSDEDRKHKKHYRDR